jgi:hypothetical protein
MVNSIQKGKSYERTVAKIVRSFGFDCRRGQQFSGGEDSPDVVSEELNWLHFECKHSKVVKIYDWIDQATRDAGESKIPLVAFRRDRSDDMVSLRLSDFMGIIREVMDARSREQGISGTSSGGIVREQIERDPGWNQSGSDHL